MRSHVFGRAFAALNGPTVPLGRDQGVSSIVARKRNDRVFSLTGVFHFFNDTTDDIVHVVDHRDKVLFLFRFVFWGLCWRCHWRHALDRRSCQGSARTDCEPAPWDSKQSTAGPDFGR